MATQASQATPTEPRAPGREAPEAPAPRPYRPPTLRRLGSVRDLTLGRSTGAFEAGKRKTRTM
jgi:hypothetical protein